MGPLIEEVLSQREHRPGPLPRLPWIMCQSWEKVLFLHWPMPMEGIRPLVPSRIEIDTYDGQAWLTMVILHIVKLHLRALPPLPGLSAFPQINLRTYVRVKGQPGVFFFSIDAKMSLGAWVGQHLFHLPYRGSKMEFGEQGGGFHIESHRPASESAPAADFVGGYRPIGVAFQAEGGTPEHFLTERYTLFAEGLGGILYRGDLNHLPWELKEAEAQVEINTIPHAAGIELPEAKPMMHFSSGTDSILWPVIPTSL